jgi:hypothetical protein
MGLMMNERTKIAVDLLAEYFTGSSVAHHSIALGMGGSHRIHGQIFFDVRTRLGIRGYDDKEVAKRVLTEMIEGRP